MIPDSLVYSILGVVASVLFVIIFVPKGKPKVKGRKRILTGREFVQGVRSGRIKNVFRDEKSIEKLTRSMTEDFVLPEETRARRLAQKVVREEE